eukprot:13972816-Alexandrium_andersonii.AAC.1
MAHPIGDRIRQIGVRIAPCRPHTASLSRQCPRLGQRPAYTDKHIPGAANACSSLQRFAAVCS